MKWLLLNCLNCSLITIFLGKTKCLNTAVYKQAMNITICDQIWHQFLLAHGISFPFFEFCSLSLLIALLRLTVFSVGLTHRLSSVSSSMSGSARLHFSPHNCRPSKDAVMSREIPARLHIHELIHSSCLADLICLWGTRTEGYLWILFVLFIG